MQKRFEIGQDKLCIKFWPLDVDFNNVIADPLGSAGPENRSFEFGYPTKTA